MTIPGHSEDRKKLFELEISLSHREHDHLVFCNFSRHRHILDCPTCKRLWEYPDLLASWLDWEVV